MSKPIFHLYKRTYVGIDHPMLQKWGVDQEWVIYLITEIHVRYATFTNYFVYAILLEIMDMDDFENFSD